MSLRYGADFRAVVRSSGGCQFGLPPCEIPQTPAKFSSIHPLVSSPESINYAELCSRPVVSLLRLIGAELRANRALRARIAREVVMSRMRLALAITAASVAAGAAGCAVGLFFAPASGSELRRRLAWRAEHEYRSMGRACEGMFDRAAELAKRELKARAERVLDHIGKACAG